MAGKRFICSNLPLGSTFPGGPYEKGKEKLVDEQVLSHPIIKALMNSGDLYVVDMTQKSKDTTESLKAKADRLEKELAETKAQLKVIEEQKLEAEKIRDELLASKHKEEKPEIKLSKLSF